MSTAEIYGAYIKNQVQTLSQEKLVLMLYDGALKFITQGKQACEAKDLEKTNYYLVRAQAIIAELMGNLDPVAGEITANLSALYDYMYRRLIEANIKKDPLVMEEVHELLKDLRNTWVEVIRSSQAKTQDSVGQRMGITV